MGLFDEQLTRKKDAYPWALDLIRAMRTGFWSPDEFTFGNDRHNFYNALNPQEQEVIVRALTCIGQIEISVKSFWGDLGKNLPIPRLSDLGYTIASTEVIHGEAYEKLIIDGLDMEKSFEVLLKEPVIRDRARYLRKYLDKVYKDDKKNYLYKIILFTIFIENVSLFSQFYVILWFNRFRGVLSSTAQQVGYTRLEESLHARAGMKIINTLREEYPELFTDELEMRVLAETKEAWECEKAVIAWILQGYEQNKLTLPVLYDFIGCRLNDSLKEIGFDEVLDVRPNREFLWFEEELLGNSMTDFFHKKPVDYSRNNRDFENEDLF